MSFLMDLSIALDCEKMHFPRAHKIVIGLLLICQAILDKSVLENLRIARVKLLLAIRTLLKLRLLGR